MQALAIILQLAAVQPIQDADPWKQVEREARRGVDGKATSRPAGSPFESPGSARRPGARPGVVHLSNGEKLPGWISSTTAKPLKLFVRKSQRFLDVGLDEIAMIETRLDWERMEDDWRWAEQGSDVKVRTGKKYPARKTYYVVTTIAGKTITADIRAPLWIESDRKARRLALHSRHKAPPDTTLDELIYVKRVDFSASRMKKLPSAPNPPATQPATQPSKKGATKASPPPSRSDTPAADERAARPL